MPRNSKKKLNVFICTTSVDLTTAKDIRMKLGQYEWVRPWLYTEDILSGRDWESEISVAMTQAHNIIICFSKASEDKTGYFQKEIKEALKRQEYFPEGAIGILPLKLNECAIPKSLQRLAPLEYNKPEEAFEKLIQSLASRAKFEGVKLNKAQSVNKPKKLQETRTTSSTSISSNGNYGESYVFAPRVLCELVLDEDIQYFDIYRQNTIRFVLAKLLSVDEKYIVIKSFINGSIKIVIELPEKDYVRLSSMVEKRDEDLYRLFKLKSFRALKQVVVRQPLREKIESSANLLVGREVEINAFRGLLENPYGDKRIALILGDGGIGKTLLVKEFLEQARKMVFLASEEPIDLFSTDYRHIDGIQWKVIEIIETLSGLTDDQSPFARYKKGKADTSDKFYDCLKEFCATHPLVLAFDTFENLDEVASSWLFRDERGGLQVPGLICIIAGREEGREKEELDAYRNNPLVQEIPISGFLLKDTLDFYQKIAEEFQSPLDSDPLGKELLKSLGMETIDPIRAGIKRVWELTNGHPLKLEMAFRWPGELLHKNSLAELTADQYEEKLMKNVREWGEQDNFTVGSLPIRQPVFDTLLCMAYVIRRFDIHFLQFLIKEKLIRFDDPDVSKTDVLEYLRRYFFVKNRGKGDEGFEIIQLHDEMARLVRQYVWQYLDATGDKRKEIYRAVIRFYDTLIEQSPNKLAETLQVEQLYYMLQLDREGAGIQRWFELTELGNENIDKLLPGEIKAHIKYYDVETRVRVHSRIAEMERNAYHINQALGHWEEVSKIGEVENREDWMVDSLVGKFNCVWREAPEEALKEYLLPAQVICERSFPERLAFVYFEIGFAYRQMQEITRATEWYEMALLKLRHSPEDSPLEAILFNDIGYAYLQLGRWGDASKYLNEALDIRLKHLHQNENKLESATNENLATLRAERNQSALFVGLSYNTLGEFHRYVDDLEEALIKYNEAYKYFINAGDYFWQAKALCARGETHRRLARQAWQANGKESNYQEQYSLAREDIENSLYLCEKYRLEDEKDSAYRRLGRLLHDQGMVVFEQGDPDSAGQDLERAYAYFRQGLEYAKKTNDVLEEFENLIELAFLADDAIVIFGRKSVPDDYHGAVEDLKQALDAHRHDAKPIYLYPVFNALLKMEEAAITFADGNPHEALEGYVEAFKGLGMFPGYGHARYKQHFDHLTSQVRKLPREEQERWAARFVDVWESTPMPRRDGRYLADDLLPDLVKWFNKLMKI